MNTTVELPKDIMMVAVTLRNSVRSIYLAIFNSGKPCTANEVASLVMHDRAYVNMRLNQLEDMGHIKSFRKGRSKLYEVKRKE